MRTSIISARNSNHELVAPLLYNGTADTELVVFWVKQMLLAALPNNSILVWDNASFHTSKQLQSIIEDAGHSMIFLPPYSPDLNPIEHKWEELKHNLKKYYDETIGFIENLIREVNRLSSV
jgi:transposase